MFILKALPHGAIFLSILAGLAVLLIGQVKTPPGAAAETQTLDADDITVAYRSCGRGTSLVLITGFGSTLDMWDPDFLADLAGQFRVIVFDNRGMGRTTGGTEPFSIARFADDAAAFMTALGLKKAHVLGWSMGSYVAQELALRHPDRVDRLVLYATAPGGPEAVPPADDVIARLTDPSGSDRERGARLTALLFPPEWLAKNGAAVGRAFSGVRETSSPESIGRQSEAIEKWPGTFDRLPGIKSPTLLVTGTADVIAPIANAEKMAPRIPGGRLVPMEGGGHGLMYQFPSELACLVADFLNAR